MCPAPVNDNVDRGFIIPIGGGEDRVKEMQIHRKFVELSGGTDADIVVIPTASQLEETGPDYNRIFRELGAGQVEFLPITTKAYLYLSGTPFKALATGEFIEEQIFNWTYTDEQRAKEEFVAEAPG